ncbi:MAG: hypothetical protein ACKKMV_01005 [Candidatus Nealsonbacteria bacterium]
MVSFTIEVEKKEKDEEFSFEDLNIYHGECKGKLKVSEINGKIKKEWPYYNKESYLELACHKCKTRIWVRMKENLQTKILNTAINDTKEYIWGENGYWGKGYQGKILKKYSPKILSNEACDFSRVEISLKQKKAERQKKPEEKIEEIHCPYCGGQLTPKGVYCPFCGTNIADRILEITTKKTE